MAEKKGLVTNPAYYGRLGGQKSKGRKLTDQHKQHIRETKLRQAAIIRQYQKEHEGEV